MALSNSQYNELMRIYEQRQLDAVHQVQERYEDASHRRFLSLQK